MSELQEQLTLTPAAPSDGLLELTLAEIEAKLKAERVQERLAKMPGWSLAHGGHAIDRLRELGSPMTAADYAGFVLREAARCRQKVRTALDGTRVVITVLASPNGPRRGVIGTRQLDFAEGLA